MHKSLIMLMIFIGCPYLLPQADCTTGKSVTVTRFYSSSEVTPDEAKKHALDLARSEAISQVVGVKVVAETFRNQSETTKGNKSEDYFDSFSQLSRSTSSGRIISEKVEYTTSLTPQGVPVFTAVLNACVVKEEGISDPAFKANISIEKPVFYTYPDVEKNEALKFSVTARQHCYLYLFNLLANDSVQMLIPNEYVTEAEYIPERKEQLYEIKLKALNARFAVLLPEGKNSSKEALYLVVLKDKIPFTFLGRNESCSSVSSAFTDIMQWLMKIPADRRTEAFQSYEIRRNSN